MPELRWTVQATTTCGSSSSSWALLALNTILFLSRCAKALGGAPRSSSSSIVVPFVLLAGYPAWGQPCSAVAGWVCRSGSGLRARRRCCGGTLRFDGQRDLAPRVGRLARARHRPCSWARDAWVALLFSSAAVIGAADYLNGSEHPVSQLDTAVDDYQSARTSRSRSRSRGDVVHRRCRRAASRRSEARRAHARWRSSRRLGSERQVIVNTRSLRPHRSCLWAPPSSLGGARTRTANRSRSRSCMIDSCVR